MKSADTPFRFAKKVSMDWILALPQLSMHVQQPGLFILIRAFYVSSLNL